MPDDLRIFPTRLKVKISSKLSYPVGAELLSAALAEIPQIDHVQVSFYNKYERLDRRGKPHPILSARYFPHGTFLQEGDPVWEIIVHPVPRTQRHVVRKRLQEEFLPMMRDWFLQAHTIVGEADLNSIKIRGFSVIYDEASENWLRIEQAGW